MTTRSLIFLSYARKDGAARAQRLVTDLEAAGYEVWLDRQRIEGGSSWSLEIETAIERCAAMVAVLSEGSYESRVCRGEHITALDLGKPLVPVLAQATARRPVYLAADHYLLFDTEAAHAQALPPLLAALEGRGSAELAAPYRQRYVSERPLPLVYLPREAELATLRQHVIAEGRSGAVALTALKGMGGSGKTVLASALLRDDAIDRAFPDGRAWIEIGHAPTDAHLLAQAKEAARSLGEDFSTVASLREASNRLRSVLRDKAALLVLDDVWSAADANPFVVESPQSSILLTTRSEAVARGLGAEVCELHTMQPQAALELLARWSKTQLPQLPAAAAEIVRECGRLPLALAMVGASLAGKPAATWQRRLERLRAADLARIGIPLADYAFPDVFKAIDASVAELPPDEQARYRQLAVFGDDAHVPAATLCTLWGLDALDVDDLIEAWSDASLAATDEHGRLTLHDLQSDYMRFTTPDVAALQRELLERYRALSPDGWHAGPDDGYFHDHLAWHLAQAGLADELDALLLDARWLEARLRRGGIEALLDDYRVAATTDALTLRDALRLSSRVLARAPLLLAGQLAGRLAGSHSPRLQQLLVQAAALQIGPWLQPLTPSLEAPGGPLLLAFDGAGSFVRHMAVSARFGRVAALSDQGLLFVLDAASGRTMAVVRREAANLARGIAMLDAQRVVVVTDESELEVWDSASGTLVARHGTGELRWNRVLARDGKIGLAERQRVELRDAATGELLRGFDCPRVAGIDLDAGGDALLVYDEFKGRLSLFDAASGKLRAEVIDEEDLAGSAAIALTPDATCAYVADLLDGVYEVELRTGDKLRTLRKRGDQIVALALSADGSRLLAGDKRGDIALWDTARAEALQLLQGHTDPIRALAICGADRAASCSEDGMLRLWNLEARLETPAEPPHVGLVLRVAANRDGSTVWSSHPREWLRSWQVGEKALPRDDAYGLESGRWWVMGFDATSEHAALRSDDSGNVVVLRLRDGQLGATFSSYTTSDVAVLSPGGDALAWTPIATTLRLAWLTADGQPTHELTLLDDQYVRAAAFSGDGSVLAAVVGDDRVRLWDTHTGALLREVDAGQHIGGYGCCIALSPDGTRALAGPVTYGDGGTYVLLDLQRAQVIDVQRFDVVGPAPKLPAIAWSAQADCLAITAGTRLVVLRARGALPLLWEADAPLSSCALSGDGTLAVAGDETGRVHVLHLRDGVSGAMPQA